MTFLSHVHAELRRARLTRRGATHPPDQVPRGLHKEYSRMQRISLPDPKPLAATLQDVLERRSSGLSGDPEAPITLEETGTLLGSALRKRTGALNRNYPSGGALYPVETYIISTALESQTPAVFHYNPSAHALERLWDLPQDFNIKSIAVHPDFLALSSLIVFTSVWKRSSAKYGHLAYLHALIEAGHMSENVLLVGTALGLSSRPYAGFDDARVAQLLDLNEEEEQAIHSIALCKKKSSAADTHTSFED